jgi:hypothetical protein
MGPPGSASANIYASRKGSDPGIYGCVSGQVSPISVLNNHHSFGNIMRPNMVAKKPNAWIKKPAGVGTPPLLIMGIVDPTSPWTMRKVSGLAKIKKTNVL